MPHIDVTFGPGGQRLLGTQEVYTRVNWADAWVIEPDLWCEQATWSKAPAMPVASFSWDYGLTKEPEASVFAKQLKKTGITRVWVKARISTEVDVLGTMPTRVVGVTTGERNWYGFIDIDEDQLAGVRDDGAGGTVISGRQTFGAYGLERLLATHELRSSFWDALGTVREAEVPFVFNDPIPGLRHGNRTSAKIVPPTSYLFESDPTLGDYWTSANIVEHLIVNQTPRDDTGAVKVPFELEVGFDAIVPNWDKPIIPQDGETTYSLLTRLIPLQRLLMWHIQVDEIANVAMVIIDSATSAAVVLDLPGTPEIPANGETRDIDFDADQLTSGVIKSSEVRTYDQVIAEGAVKVSVGTFNFKRDGTILKGWTDAKELLYEQAASLGGGYGALSVVQKMERNAIVRSKPELQNVFTRLSIDRFWDLRCGDGTGNLSGYAPTHNAMFITGDPHELPAPTDAIWPNICFSQLFLEQSLPLYAGIDYSVDAIKDGIDEIGASEQLGPLVWIDDPDTFELKVRVEMAGQLAAIEETGKADHAWSGLPSIHDKSKSVDVRVNGAPQYAIAFTDMTLLAGIDDPLGEHEWDTLVFTLAINDQRRLEGVWPAVLPAQDIIRTKHLRSEGSEDFVEIYVVPGTMVGVDVDGVPQWSSGGFIRRPNDGPAQLEAVAKVAGAYYTVAHKVVSVLSYRSPEVAQLDVGDMILTVGNALGHEQTVNSVITEISVTWKQGDGTDQGNAAPEFRLLSFAGELDNFQFEPIASVLSSASDIPAALPPGFDPGRFNLGRRGE